MVATLPYDNTIKRHVWDNGELMTDREYAMAVIRSMNGAGHDPRHIDAWLMGFSQSCERRTD